MKARRPYLESLEKRYCLDGAGIGAVVAGEGPPSFAGDANCDGLFDTEDLVQVLQHGKYNSGRKASWQEGDWNQDGVFDTGDMVTALVHGRYGLKRFDHGNGPPEDVPRGNGPPADHDPPGQGDTAEITVEGDPSMGEIVITSTKDLSNIVYRVSMLEDGSYYDTKIDCLEGMDYMLQVEVEEGSSVTDLWVKSGNNKSGDGPGYGQRFEWSDGSWMPTEMTDSEETPPDGDPPADGDPPIDTPPDDVPHGKGPPTDVPRGDGQPEDVPPTDVPRGDGQPDDVPPTDVPRGNGPPEDVPRGEGRPEGIPPCDLPPHDVPRRLGPPDDVPRGDGQPDDGETDPPVDPSVIDAAIAEI
jgi:hypothetical protein